MSLSISLAEKISGDIIPRGKEIHYSISLAMKIRKLVKFGIRSGIGLTYHGEIVRHALRK